MLNRIFGRHHDQCVEVIRNSFRKMAISGVEIGTNAGDLTKTLLRDCLNIYLLHTVDPWLHVEGQQFEAGHPQEYHNEQEAVAREKLKEFEDRVAINKMTSDEFFKIYVATPDFVWIDGHHTGEQVRKDIENAKKVVRKGGLIGGHDFGLVGEVTAVVLEQFGDKGLTLGGDYTWWVYV